MKIVAVAGLAQNFGAINSLITTGIQKGHMKMHLINILNSLNANDKEKEQLINFFKKNTVSYSSAKNELINLRKMDFNISSPGKLLITSEYYVTKGALALAIPTKFRQSLEFKCDNSNKLKWKSFDEKMNYG